MATFLLEVRTEEIPANALPGARRQLEQLFTKHLTDVGFDGAVVRALSTSLRLVVLAENLPERQADRKEEMMGPPVRLAFGDDGKPTKAAEGFAKKTGLPLDEIRRVETPKGEYLAATVTHTGRTTIEILAESTPKILGALRFPKMMRWGIGTHLFVRPVHGIVALLDSEIVPFDAFGIASGRSTHGHRVHSPDAFDLAQADDYQATLENRSVMVDPEDRRQALEDRAQSLAAAAGCRPHPDARLVAEHVELVEWPGLISGTFETRFLDLPPEVVVSTLRHHQKCLILEDEAGALLPHFLAVIDRKDDPEDLIRLGNEWVIRARLADAGFFFDEDRKQPFEDNLSRLERVEWHRTLGSLEAKAERVSKLAVSLSEALELDQNAADLCRAARLVKADLVTYMVGEFPELQGIMGGHYLRLEGADEELWTAARDHYRPVGFEGSPPISTEGRLLGLADRLDTIAGLFAVGEKPTGSRDPLGLRRAAQAIVKIVVESGWALDLRLSLLKAVDGVAEHAGEDLEGLQKGLIDFLADRVRRWLTDIGGVAGDTADAVMAAGWSNIPETVARAQALEATRNNETFRALALAFKRVRNITDPYPDGEIDPSLFEHAEESELHGKIIDFHTALERLLPEHRIGEAFQAMAPIADTLDRFFDEVLVMAEDNNIRANRIALLKTLGQDFLALADLSKLQIDGGE